MSALTNGRAAPAARRGDRQASVIFAAVVAVLVAALVAAIGAVVMCGPAAALAIPAQTLAVAADTASVPAGSGAEEGPWSLDPDEALLRGYVLIVAEEDTIAFAPGTLDTILVTAPRVKVSEVVRRIGERMAADQERMGDHAWTSITRAVARESEEPGGERDRTEYELVERVLMRADGSLQTARLRRVERKYRDGRLVKEKVDDEIEGDWREITATAAAIPFSLESGDDYNYEILARDLLGDHLVYTIRFTPRSRFQALPSGTVWIDTSDFVIRRLEASLTGAVPLPLVIKSVPWIKLRRVRRGDFWVLDDMMAKVVLHKGLPLLPASFEFYVRHRDHMIGGVAHPDEPDSATSWRAGP